MENNQHLTRIEYRLSAIERKLNNILRILDTPLDENWPSLRDVKLRVEHGPGYAVAELYDPATWGQVQAEERAEE
jgi:hypothetical protein